VSQAAINLTEYAKHPLRDGAHVGAVNSRRSERRDVTAAKAFFRKAMKQNGTPRVVTLDAYAASHRAVADLKPEGKVPKRVRSVRASISIRESSNITVT
jgi:transposase-like protein